MITSFSGKYRFLSNFYLVYVYYEGYVYNSVEHAYQAEKCLWARDRLSVSLCATPGQAKRMTRNMELKPDWDNTKLDVMKKLVQYKFMHNASLGFRLTETHPHVLIEGNNWGDTFWGCVLDDAGTGLIGDNHLGKILMDVRNMLMKD